MKILYLYLKSSSWIQMMNNNTNYIKCSNNSMVECKIPTEWCKCMAIIHIGHNFRNKCQWCHPNHLIPNISRKISPKKLCPNKDKWVQQCKQPWLPKWAKWDKECLVCLECLECLECPECLECLGCLEWWTRECHKECLKVCHRVCHKVCHKACHRVCHRVCLCNKECLHKGWWAILHRWIHMIFKWRCNSRHHNNSRLHPHLQHQFSRRLLLLNRFRNLRCLVNWSKVKFEMILDFSQIVNEFQLKILNMFVVQNQMLLEFKNKN